MKRLLWIPGILFPFLCSSQCLNGTYTIGGASPDYVTITNAVAALTTNGVCGPVVFNIRSGTYTEQFSVTNISGASFVNTITFQSEALDSTAVTIQYNATTSTNYHVAKVSGTDHVTFNKLHILNTSSSYATGIYFTGSAVGCAVTNCILEATYAPAQNTSAGVYISNVAADSLVVNNCVFRGNNFGFSTSWLTQSGNYAGMRIANSEFVGQEGMGIYVRQGNRTVIENNTVTVSNVYGGADGIVVSQYSLDDTVRNNVVSAPGFGISISYNTYALVYNNFVTSDSSAAFNLGGSADGRFFHNTFVSNAPVDEAVIQCSNFPDYFKKNIAVHNNGGPLYNVDGSPYPLTQTTQNIFYTSGPIFGIENGNFWNDLGEWYWATGMDDNSRFNSPQFVSFSDYHVASDFSQNLHTDSLPFVPLDIDGDARNSSSPYPGADEGTIIFAPRDVSAVAVTSPSDTVLCGGPIVFGVRIRNNGSLMLTSVNLTLEINGIVQPTFLWTGFLGPGDTVTVSVGPVNVSSGDSIIVVGWTDSPNFSSDMYPANDTLAYAEYAVKLAGTYTIGGANPDFATMNEAVDKLIRHGICAPVVFNIRDGLYTEQVMIPAIAGASLVNTITFQSESGDSSMVVIQSSATSAADNYTIWCDGTAFCNFYQITIRQNGSTFNTALRIGNSADYIGVSNCGLVATGTAGDSNDGCVVHASGSHAHVVIDSSYFSGGYYGLRSTGLLWNAYNSISNNFFTSHSYGAINVEDQGRLTVLRNVYIDTAYRMRGFEFSELSDSSIIAENKISGRMISALYCRFFNSTLSDPAPMFIVNNMVSVCSLDTVTSSALFMNECSNTHVLFNNFYNYTQNALPDMYGIAYYANSSRDDVEFLNNHIVCNDGGTAMRVSHVQSLQWVSNYNNLYSETGTVGFYNGINYPTLAAWQTATSQDSLSLCFDPVYFTSSDLHVNVTQGVDVGTPVAGITTDFDGELRSNPPDIGADEFNVTSVTAESNGASVPEIFPNPASDLCTIKFSAVSSSEVNCVFTDAAGRMISMQVLSPVCTGSCTATLSLSGLPTGLYFISVYDKAGSLLGVSNLAIAR